MSLALWALILALAVLSLIAFGPSARAAIARRRARGGRPRQPAWDPGRERRAQRKAEDLLRSVVGEEGYSMYRELGFLRAAGGERPGSGYAYLIYPHRPIVAFEERDGELLNEYCVGFPDETDPALGTRLPDADDVLAKWMALRADERKLIADANMHLPGRQLDPEKVRRDVRRLHEWERRRAGASRQAA